MKEEKPEVFRYTNFRTYLKDYFDFAKSQDKKFSHRFIAYQIGASSAGWFSNIISGRINLTGTLLLRLIKLLKLNAQEQEFFQLLVDYDQAGSIEEKKMYVEKMFSIKGIDPAIIGKDQFDFYRKWYISVIRELLFIYDFKDNFTELAKKLNPPIKPTEAKKAIAILSSLKMIAQNSSGFYKPCAPVIKKEAGFKTVCWANHMKAKIQLGLEAIDRFSKEERDLSEVYVPLSEQGFAELKNEIASLRKKILSLSERDKNRNMVFQCNIQFFPLTKKIKETP